jgi:hypothetical protein
MSMLPRQALMILATLVAATLLWAGDEPWKAKPYQSWDAKDIEQIMTHSPWVASTEINRDWQPVGQKHDVRPTQPLIGSNGGGVRAQPNVTGNTPGVSGSPAADSPHETVFVYWASSTAVRVAEARRAVLNGAMPESDVQKYAASRESEYAITVAMPDMTPFEGKGPNDFQNACFLEGKKSKLKVPPSRAEYHKKDGLVVEVEFFFPKTTSSGQATVASDETDVVFSCKLGHQDLRVGFKPTKMVDQFGPDI